MIKGLSCVLAWVPEPIALGHQPAGMYQSRGHAAYWDSKNAFGEPLASVLYFYTLTADDFTAIPKWSFNNISYELPSSDYIWY